jgi:hypothetical protein
MEIPEAFPREPVTSSARRVVRPEQLSRSEEFSQAFHRAVAKRLAEDRAGVLAQARRNLATMRRANGPRAKPWLDEWERLLDGPTDELLTALRVSHEHTRDLRQNTPFAGVIPPRERWEILADVRRRRAARPA